MPVMITPELVEPVTRALWGAIAVNDGPTDEQVAVLRAVVVHLWQRPDLELAQRLEALHDLEEGTLGYAYIEFYRRNQVTVPGADTHTRAHYVSHDMNHVIAGYEPTGP